MRLTRTVLFFLALACALVAWTPAAHACWSCCLPDGSCVDLIPEEECYAQGGSVSSDTFCADRVCTGELACRMTGGGVDTSGRWNGSYVDGEDELNRYTFGGQVGAPTASQPQPSGEWTHHQMRGPDGDFVFHAGTASAPRETRIVEVICSDPGYCEPARPAPAKQIDYVGIGQFKNIRSKAPLLADVVAGSTLHWFEAHVEDLGEPGRGGKVEPPAEECRPAPLGSSGRLADCECPDFYSIAIHATADPTSAVIYHVAGYITGGNLQIHPPIK